MKKPIKNRALLKRWVDALESGRYLQGTSTLRADGEYCCLGVLCSVSKAGRWRKVTRTGEPAWQFDYGEPVWAEADLSEALIKKMDLVGLPQATLIQMNDEKGKSFTEIAEYVREKLMGQKKKVTWTKGKAV